MATNIFQALAIAVGRPVLGTPYAAYSIHAANLAVSTVPTFTVPRFYPLFAYFDGQVTIAPARDYNDPDVWSLNRLKYDDEDGGFLSEALFANHNDDLRFECDGQSLMGRSDLDRGVVRKINITPPLILANETLTYTGIVGSPLPGQVALFTDATHIQGVDPPTAAMAIGFTTGDAKLTLKNVADSGWVLMNDGTIGDALSSASNRANIDCQPLFNLLWTNIPDAWAPVSGGRGASALADWNAHKRISLTRQLGRSLTIAGAGAGLTNRPLGGFAGEESHTMTVAEMVSHAHGVTDPTHAHSVYDPGHNHGFNDPGHGHGLGDPGHAHGVADPSHGHSTPSWSWINDASSPYLTVSAQPGDYFVTAYSGAYGNYTGIGIYGAGTGMWVGGSGTGCYNSAAGVGVGIYGAYTGVTVNANGSSSPMNVTHPVSFWNIMIKL